MSISRAVVEKTKVKSCQQDGTDNWYVLPVRYTPEIWKPRKNDDMLIVARDSGTFGPVNIVLHILPYNSLTKAAKVVRELELCVKLFHKNIVVILNIFSPQTDSMSFKYFYIFYEYMDHTLKHLLEKTEWRRERAGSTGAERYSFIAFQIFCGIDYIHKAGIVHRDLRLKTIAINKRCRVKITHLGNARHITEEAELPDELEAIPYMPPEVLEKYIAWNKSDGWGNVPAMKPDCSWDVWSAAMVLYEIAIGKAINDQLPKAGKAKVDHMLPIANRMCDSIDENIFPFSNHPKLIRRNAKDMLCKMLAKQADRISAKDAVKLTYVQWAQVPGDMDVPKSHVITTGIDKIKVSQEEWKENIFEMIKEYERNHDTNTWQPEVPQDSSENTAD